ncbi:MAG: hypothetical protein KY053_01820 [Candidatus Liptonbacteria bacterium]|nr:hypothetical protein [Candidatus Liptonbacteria bacterium]
MNETKFNVNDLIHCVFNKTNLGDRNRQILESRFGLNSPQILTLQELGDQYEITRERVRQIEESSLVKVKREFKNIEEAKKLILFTQEFLNAIGGLKRHDFLVNEFYSLFKVSEDFSIFSNELKFIYETFQDPPYLFKETGFYYNFWYVEKITYKKMFLIHKEMVKRLKKVEHFSEVLFEVIRPYKITESVAVNYLSVSKKIGVGPFGDLGLSHWEEINPRTVRAKTYLILKKADQPLHFTEIADRIKAHPPTVHNELIKNEKFKLVSRGTYTLATKK